MRRLAALSPAALFLLVLAGCASGSASARASASGSADPAGNTAAGNTAAAVASPLTLGAEPSCAVAARRDPTLMPPTTLPAVAAVMDSTAAAALLAAHPGRVSAALVYDLGAARPVVRVVERSATPGADTLAARLAGVTLDQPAAKSAWGIRLVANEAAPGALRLERARWCMPQPASTGSSNAQGMSGTPVAGSRATARFVVLVGPRGQVRSVDVISNAGGESAGLRSSLRNRRYTAGWIEGVPVTMGDTVEVTSIATVRQTTTRGRP